MNGVRATKLPRLVLVADRFVDPVVADRVGEAVEAGVTWVQLRDHEADACAFGAAAGDLVRRLRRIDSDVLISVNSRPDLAGAGIEGVHVGHRGPSVQSVRAVIDPRVVLGYAAHSIEAARIAAMEGADYVFFSPVFPTTSKPGAPAAGLDALAACAAAVDIPVFALGGITPDRVPACLEAGAYGVAVLSGILTAEDVAEAVGLYVEFLD
ncbi:MAG: thiamine phosphate synthase [Rhodothermales bacterium]